MPHSSYIQSSNQPGKFSPRISFSCLNTFVAVEIQPPNKALFLRLMFSDSPTNLYIFFYRIKYCFKCELVFLTWNVLKGARSVSCLLSSWFLLSNTTFFQYSTSFAWVWLIKSIFSWGKFASILFTAWDSSIFLHSFSFNLLIRSLVCKPDLIKTQ